ncbi:MAG: hypothetical protein IT539_03035 [Bradyrhizobiaceae bacterium]|nr:hypothetical protein [Bradyrhizobiaceae bacterium]
MLRDYALPACGGLASAVLFIAALYLLDLHGLGTLIAEDEAPLVPVVILLMGLGGTFAAAAIGTGLAARASGGRRR